MIYVVDSIEVKNTSKGKKADVSLTAVSGEKISKATIWGDFPDFNTITFGQEIEGELVPSKNPDFPAPTLYPPRKVNYTPKTPIKAGMDTVMKKKQEGIEKSMDRKEEGIRISGSMRDAVLITTTFARPDLTEEGIKAEVTKWRKWLYNEYDNLEPF